jgi:omega-hydroxy-beta-dihydromenaquinone-9 sulfotransferase
MSINDRPSTKNRGIAWPVAHVLALAPIDVWVRLIVRSGGVRPRYWLRLGFILITSFVGTIATVHERVVLYVIRRRRFRADAQINRQMIVIVGYYRTGTTHLQNLMSCDDRFVTPRWYQCLAGQGYRFGWSILRFVLVPFLRQTRPQDAVGFGPDWPGEDDFALCTWGMCSSIPGRFIWPSRWDDWKRWHGLEGLSQQELNRWRSLMAMFVWKMTRGKRNRDRVALLKTPSHSARIAELDRLFKGKVKFVHLVREPGAVIDSNVRLHESLAGHLLEDGPDVQTIRERIVEEYAYTETKCSREGEAISGDRFVRVRYQDLRADPIGTLKGVYGSLGLDWNGPCEDSVRDYLGHLGAYTSDKEPIELGSVSAREEVVRAEIVARYGLDEPTVERVEAEHLDDAPTRFFRGIGTAALWTALCIAVWLGIAWGVHSIWDSMHLRLIPAVWICGAVIGIGARRSAGNGSVKLGVVAGVFTVLAVLMTAFPVAVINYNFASTPGYTTQQWIYHNAKYGFEGLSSVASLVFVTLGAVTAYRHASRVGVEAPGTRQRGVDRIG